MRAGHFFNLRSPEAVKKSIDSEQAIARDRSFAAAYRWHGVELLPSSRESAG